MTKMLRFFMVGLFACCMGPLLYTGSYAVTPEESESMNAGGQTPLGYAQQPYFTPLPSQQTIRTLDATTIRIPDAGAASRMQSQPYLVTPKIPVAPLTGMPEALQDTEKDKASDYYRMSEIEKARMAESRMTDAEKSRLADVNRLSDTRKARRDYDRLSDIEKARFESYNRMSYAEKSRLEEFCALPDFEKAKLPDYVRMPYDERTKLSEYCKVLDLVRSRNIDFTEKSQIEKDMSDLREYNETNRPKSFSTGQLTQFGYDFFRRTGKDFSTATDVPVGDSYLVGPGDHISLQLWGSVGGIYDLEVNRSGEIFVPRIGAVKVWGVPFGKLHSLLQGHLAREFKDFQLNVTMGKLRMIKVYVVGAVNYPGDYDLNGLSSVINALSAAGGPTKNGSLRNIQIRRPGMAPESVDLYDFFLRGDKSRDVHLQSGDTVYVPVIHRVAGITGDVRRPGIYELKNEKTLAELLIMADGVTPTATLHRIQVLRVNSYDKRVVTDYNVDPRGKKKSFKEITSSIKLSNYDLVRVFQIDNTLREQIRVEGYVRRPGDFAFKPGMRVRDLFGKDDILPETYRNVAVITRLHPPDYHPEKITINLDKALAGDKKENLELREFDRIKLFSRWEMEAMPTVSIRGEVQKQGEYRLLENMRLRDLIYDAGNLKKNAYLHNAEITRIKIMGDEVMSEPIIVNLKEALNGNPDHNIILKPHDAVQVRRLPNWFDETERYVNLTGEVVFPGVYPIYKGEKLSSLLSRAGGYTAKAYLHGAKFTREPVRELQQKQMDDFIFKTEQEIGNKIRSLASSALSKEEVEASRTTLEAMQQSLAKLKQLRAEGRMIVRLEALDSLKSSPYDLELMGGDKLDIPKSIDAVVVLGEVYNPTTILHVPGKKLSYYLNQAGGPTRNAESKEMYIVKADGSIYSRQQSSFGFHWDPDDKNWSFGSFNSVLLQAGDTLVVPKKLDTTSWLRTLKDITTIISQIALTAGVVFTGLK